MSKTRWKFDPAVKLADLTDEDVLCARCGYNLRGLDTGHCPECGIEFDPEDLRNSQIPWAHRKKIGWFLAFWKTVWMGQRRLVYEIGRRQDLADARKFRLAVFGLVFLATLMALVLIMALEDGRLSGERLLVSLMITLLFLGVVACCAVVSVEYLSIPPTAEDRKTRSTAVCIYTCAPLALIVLPSVLQLIGMFLALGGHGPVDYSLAILGAVLLLVVLGVWFLHTAALIATINGGGCHGVLSVFASSAFLFGLLSLGAVLVGWVWLAAMTDPHIQFRHP